MGQPTRDARGQAQQTYQQAQQQLAPVIQGNQQQQQTNLNRATSDYNAANAGLDTSGATLGSAGKTYQNFADTGGFSDADKTNYLNRATSGVTNTGTALEHQAQLARSKSGGAGTGGEIAQIARQLGQTQADATNQAQMQLNQQINANRLAGASGLVNTGQAQTDVAKAHSLLFDANTGAASELGKQILQAYGIQYQTENQATQLLAQMANNPGILDTIAKVGGMVGGGIAGAMSGGATGVMGGITGGMKGLNA